MIYNKWNYKKQKYEDYIIKEILTLYTNNMNEIVPCCQCLKKFRYGNMYTSLEVQTEEGLEYPVCKKCYEEEQERRKKYDRLVESVKEDGN